jgi:hypothetical protein
MPPPWRSRAPKKLQTQSGADQERRPVGRNREAEDRVVEGRRTLWSDKSGLVVRALRFLGVPFGAVNGAIRVLRR